jgi:hypothetical protein
VGRGPVVWCGPGGIASGASYWFGVSPGAAEGGGAGATVDGGSAIGVVVLLANSLAPNPIAKASAPAPLNSAIAVFV